jgi:hypothetical protein
MWNKNKSVESLDQIFFNIILGIAQSIKLLYNAYKLYPKFLTIYDKKDSE